MRAQGVFDKMESLDLGKTGMMINEDSRESLKEALKMA